MAQISSKKEKKIEILVANRSEDFLIETSELLVGTFGNVHRANSLDSIVKVLHRRPNIDIILCDLQLTNGTCEEVIDFVNNNLRFRHITVAVFSSKLDQDSVARLAGKGIKGFIVPPLDADQLAQRIRETLQTTQRNVLVSDKNPVHDRVLCAMLERTGFSTVSTNSAEEIVSAVKSDSVHLVIIDPFSLDGSALELVAELKEVKPSIRVLFLMERGGDYGKEHLIASGVDGIITKPLISTVVQRKAAEVLQS